MSSEPFIFCDNLVKIYKVADLEVVALQGLDLEVRQGEMMALVGASGSGKSTLLNVIGGLDTPSAGKVVVGGHDLLKMDKARRVLYKRDVVGFVWQQPGRNLIPYLSVLENIELPMTLTRLTASRRRARAFELLEVLALNERANFRPERLSGGEQQRVALAVALANNPTLLLADEPTGQLDSEGAERVFDALRRLNAAFKTTVIVVTHDPQVVARVDRVIGIRDGRTSTEIRREQNHTDGSVQEEEWVILDQAGRLQLPQVYVDTLAMRGRVKVRLEETHLSVWPGARDGWVEGETGSGEGVRPSGERVRLWRPDQSFSLRDAPVSAQGVASPADRSSGTKHSFWAVQTDDLCRTFEVGDSEIHAVEHVSLQVPNGVLAVIKGRSGSGKTTLLNLIGGLDEPTRGSISIGGQDLAALSAEERIMLRRRQVSFVFQTFGLIPFLSARENIEAPLRLLQVSRRERQERVQWALELVGLADRAQHRVFELSGGQLQRAAVARALVSRPSLILADEPTGQLDTVTGSNIIRLLREVAHQLGITVVVASHDPKVEEAADCVYELHDGRLASGDLQTDADGRDDAAVVQKEE